MTCPSTLRELSLQNVSSMLARQYAADIISSLRLVSSHLDRKGARRCSRAVHNSRINNVPITGGGRGEGGRVLCKSLGGVVSLGN